LRGRLGLAGNNFRLFAFCGRLTCLRTPARVQQRRGGKLVPILLLEDMDMGHIATLFRRSNLVLIRLVRTVRGADTGRYFAQAKSDLTKSLSKLHSKLRSLASKLAAKTSASSS